MSEATEKTLAHLCYTTLKEAITHGVFAPGEKLRIATLKEFLKTGPTPIREALSRLASSGLVVMEANRGFFVKPVSEAEVRDIYATFNKIELLALDLAIDLGDISWEANILGALHQLSAIEKASSPIDSAHWLKLNYQFHYALIAACNSPCLLKIREDLYQLFDRFCHLSLLLNPDSLAINHQEHCEIANTVIGRDKPKANELMTMHLEKSLKLILENFKQYFN